LRPVGGKHINKTTLMTNVPHIYKVGTPMTSNQLLSLRLPWISCYQIFLNQLLSDGLESVVCPADKVFMSDGRAAPRLAYEIWSFNWLIVFLKTSMTESIVVKLCFCLDQEQVSLKKLEQEFEMLIVNIQSYNYFSMG